MALAVGLEEIGSLISEVSQIIVRKINSLSLSLSDKHRVGTTYNQLSIFKRFPLEFN